MLKNKSSNGIAQLATNYSPIREREINENLDNKSSVLSAYATNNQNGKNSTRTNDKN